ncbi:MAG: FtsL-like putative cell division protein [Chitinophagaceae bacterium]
MENKEIRNEWRSMLFSYQWIVKNIPFFLFLSLLTVIYIYNGHYAEKTIKDINKTAKKLKQLQYEYKTIRSELMFQSKESELLKAVQPIGLQELSEPAYTLSDSAIIDEK